MKLDRVIPNIFDYTDHLVLLRDYFERYRKLDSKYSMRFFSKRLEFASPNYMQRILAGERRLTEETIDRLIRILGLEGGQRDYFELMIHCKQAKDVERKTQLYNQILNLRRQMARITTLEEAQFASISSLLHYIIREMTFLKGSVENVQWVVRHIKRKISPIKVSQCLDDLANAGLIERRNGVYKACNSSINFPEEIYSLALMNYHREILNEAQEALKDQKYNEREYGAILVATTPDKFNRMKQKLKKFRREMLELMDTPDNEATIVANFSFQLFHVVDDVESQS